VVNKKSNPCFEQKETKTAKIKSNHLFNREGREGCEEQKNETEKTTPGTFFLRALRALRG
jgi:hypothetical protein